MNQIQKQPEKALSVVEKLAMVGERPPLIKDDPQTSLDVIFKGLVRTYAFLGHRNIFKGDENQRRAAKLQIQEIASQILEAYRNNPKYRRITDVDFNAIIDKGCASGLEEIKNVSPKAILDWTSQFLKLYLEQIQRKRIEYQKLQDHRNEDKNEEIRNTNIEGVRSLLQYCIEPNTNPYTDVKQFQGFWLAKVCERYADELPEDFKANFSKRQDLYEEAIQKSKKVARSNENPSEIKARAKKLYCYKLVDALAERVEFEGTEYYETTMIKAINEHHDKNK